jgi:hypothetical protein
MSQQTPVTILVHRAFVGPTLYFNFKSLAANREMIRAQAVEFVNTQVGVENVVSIQEHVTSNGPFSVVVYYRQAVWPATSFPAAAEQCRG